jgi:glycogen synthase
VRIGVISNFYPPHSIGGYERLCADVADGLLAAGHKIHILTSNYGCKDSGSSDPLVERTLRLTANYDNIYHSVALSVAERTSIVKSNQIALSRFTDGHDYDVLFLWNLYFLDNEFIESVLKLRNVAMFLTDNWLIAAQRPQYINEFFLRFVHGKERFDGASIKLNESATRLNVHAMFGSRFMGDLYHSCGLVFDSQSVVHNGVRISMTPEGGLIDRRKLCHQESVRLLFAGRVVDVKGLHILIEALPIIDDRMPPGIALEVNVVGDTQDREYSDELRRRIAELGYGKSVHFRPPVPEWLMRSLFNEHDIYVFPSLYEPFSLTLIHGLAAGIPTIASSVGGNTEIVADGRSGILVEKNNPLELADAVVRLVEEPELRARLSEGGQRSAKRFTFQRMVGRIATELLHVASANA